MNTNNHNEAFLKSRDSGVQTADMQLRRLTNRLTGLFNEQERTRKNLEAAGSQTQQGQNYLSRLAAQENDIDEVHREIAAAEQLAKEAQSAYDKYILEMNFG